MSALNVSGVIEKFVFEHGKEYVSKAIPKDIERGKFGHCFDNCAIQAALNGKYRYVEGLAESPEIPDYWILHAWLTDGVHAYDPTWVMKDTKGNEYAVPTRYIGFEVDRDRLVAFMIETEYCSILENAWRSPKLAQEAIPNLPIKKNL